MSFADAVRTCLSQYAVFSGRARRSEYWWFFLFTSLASLVAAFLDPVLGGEAGAGLATLVVSLGLLLPSLAVGVRRLHDTGRSGWWLLIGLVPVLGWIVLIVFLATDGHPQPNAHGPSPKGEPVGYGYPA